MIRAPRRTRAEIELAEAQQIEVIVELHRAGLADLAFRVQRCMEGRAARRGDRGAARPRLCRVPAACHACRRTVAAHWWRSCVAATHGYPVLRLAIPVTHVDGEVALAVTRLTRRLRWWRERSGRRFGEIGFFGMVFGDVAHTLAV